MFHVHTAFLLINIILTDAVNELKVVFDIGTLSFIKSAKKHSYLSYELLNDVTL